MGGVGEHSGRRAQHGESMEAGDETAKWGPAWESDRKEVREKGGSPVPENLACCAVELALSRVLWQSLCSQQSGTSYLHFRKMTDS